MDTTLPFTVKLATNSGSSEESSEEKYGFRSKRYSSMISGQITSMPMRSGLALCARNSFWTKASWAREVSGNGECSTRIPVSRAKRSVSPVCLAREGTELFWPPLFPATSGNSSGCDHSGSSMVIVTERSACLVQPHRLKTSTKKKHSESALTHLFNRGFIKLRMMMDGKVKIRGQATSVHGPSTVRCAQRASSSVRDLLIIVRLRPAR